MNCPDLVCIQNDSMRQPDYHDIGYCFV